MKAFGGLAFVFGMVVSAAVVAAEEVAPLPPRDLFAPVLADPKQPRFEVSVLAVDGTQRDTTVAAVGFGENFGLVRWPGEGQGNGWQLNLAGAVFAQFDLDAPSSDLVNSDYLIGFPLTHRNGASSMRLRWYHQSSHLGDEFLLRVQPERVNLSFEAIEVLVSYELATWRVYGGGEYLYHREPEELEPALLHGGGEYRSHDPLLRIGRMGMARPTAGVDVKAWEQHDWKPMWSVKAGLEFRPASDVTQQGRYWSMMLELYDGPSSFGQFFTEEISYWGIGIVVGL